MKKQLLNTALKPLLLLLCLFTFTALSAKVTIWVYSPNAANPYIHIWNSGDDGTKQMTKSATVGGKTWYYVTLDNSTNYALIFATNSDTNQNKTEDITNKSGNSYFYYDGKGGYVDLTGMQSHKVTVFFQPKDDWWYNGNAKTHIKTWGSSGDITPTWPYDEMSYAGTLDGFKVWTWSLDNQYDKTPTGCDFSRYTENTLYNTITFNSYYNGIFYYGYYNGESGNGTSNIFQNLSFPLFSELYLIGDPAGGWDKGIKMSTSDNVTFTCDVMLSENNYFRFADVAGNDGNQLGPSTDGYEITTARLGVAQDLVSVNKEKAFCSKVGGKYTVTVNTSTKKMTITRTAPTVYVFDSANPYMQATDNSGNKLRGSNEHGSVMEYYTQVGNVGWYNAPLSGGTYPISFTLTRINRVLATTPNSVASGTASDLYFYFDEENGTYVNLTEAQAKTLRKIYVNVLRSEAGETAPTITVTKNSNSESVFSGSMTTTGVGYGKVWWKKPFVVFDKLNITASKNGKSVTKTAVEKDIYLYIDDSGNLVEVPSTKLDEWKNDTGVTVHLEKTSNVTSAISQANPAQIICNAWTRDTGAHTDVPIKVTQGADVTTSDGRSWYTFTVAQTIGSFEFWIGEKDNGMKSPVIDRKSGTVWYTWDFDGGYVKDNDNRKGSLEDFTRLEEGYEIVIPECAVMLTDHHYVYYTDVKNWGDDNVCAYAWRNDEANIPGGMNNWPGVKMTKVGYDNNGNPVFVLDLTELGVTDATMPDWIIFNDGNKDNQSNNKRQTSDIEYDDRAAYDYLGCLYAGDDLVNLIDRGLIDSYEYTINDDLMAVFYDANHNTLYCKDLNKFANKSTNPLGKTDYMYTYLGDDLMRGYKTRYDQSNWVKLIDVTSGTTLNLASYEGKRIPGKSIKGQMHNNVNPEFNVASIAKAASAYSTEVYAPNVFVTAHFVDKYVDPTHEKYNDLIESPYFFVAPKPLEYAVINWAVWNATDKCFYIPKKQKRDDKTGGGNWDNEKDLIGGIRVKWDLYRLSDSEYGTMPAFLRDGEAYKFHAVVAINSDDTDKNNAPRRIGMKDDFFGVGTSNYVAYPIDINDSSSIVTGISDIAGEKTVEAVRYYNLMGVQSDRPFDGVNIVVTRYSDGTTDIVKVMK